jgi:hypothetical protein
MTHAMMIGVVAIIVALTGVFAIWMERTDHDSRG